MKCQWCFWISNNNSSSSTPSISKWNSRRREALLYPWLLTKCRDIWSLNRPQSLSLRCLKMGTITSCKSMKPRIRHLWYLQSSILVNMICHGFWLLERAKKSYKAASTWMRKISGKPLPTSTMLTSSTLSSGEVSLTLSQAGNQNLSSSRFSRIRSKTTTDTIDP